MNEPQRQVLSLTPGEAALVERLRQYRADLPRHAQECFKLVDKRGRLVPMGINRPQALVALRLKQQVEQHGMVRALVLKGRKQGVSTYIAARFYARTRLYRYQVAKVMAHVQDSTNALFSMVQTLYTHDPVRLQADRSNAGEFLFSNGSRYKVATAGGSGESGRGDTPTLAHMSEVAFYKNAEKNFAAFANSVPTEPGTEIIGESTANGMGNEFHRRWILAEAGLVEGDGGLAYQPIFVPWWLSDEYRLPLPERFELSGEPEGEKLPSERDVAEIYGLDMQQMAWRRFQILQSFGGSIETFMQEFPCTPSEAFQSPGLRPLISPVLVARARKRRDIVPAGPRVLGIDPAGNGGDRFCMTLRQGHVVPWKASRVRVETQDAVEWVAAVIMEQRPDRVYIDNGGGWAASVINGIKVQYPKLAALIYPVDFGGRSQFKTAKPNVPGPRNRRAEMYLRAAEWFDLPEGVSIPDDDSLQTDLGAITQRLSGVSTDVLIESKQEIRKRLGRSPDEADSLALTFATPDRVIPTALTQNVRTDTTVFDKGSVDRPDYVVHGGFHFDSGGGWMT